MRIGAGAALTLAMACGGGDAPQDSVPADPQDTTAQAEEASMMDVARRYFEAVPESLRIRRGACPFECCVYGEWRAESAIPLAVRPSMSADSVHVLQPGERFVADSGEVHVLGPAIVAVFDTIRGPGNAVRFVPDDTLVVLDHVGEGHWNVLYDGRVVREVQGFWGAEFDGPQGAYYGDYRKEWWVHAVTDQISGWFRADSTFRYSGADACAG